LPLKPADTKAHTKSWHIRIQNNMFIESFLFLLLALLPHLH